MYSAKSKQVLQLHTPNFKFVLKNSKSYFAIQKWNLRVLCHSTSNHRMRLAYVYENRMYQELEWWFLKVWLTKGNGSVDGIEFDGALVLLMGWVMSKDRFHLFGGGVLALGPKATPGGAGDASRVGGWLLGKLGGELRKNMFCSWVIHFCVV